MTNKGDTLYLVLDYTINDEPLEDCGASEIEFQLNSEAEYNCVKYLLSDGSIYKNEDGKYEIKLSQDDTYKLANGPSTLDTTVKYQLRVDIGGDIASSDIGVIYLGPVLSRRVI